MLELLAAEAPVLNWVSYCAMTVDNQAIWEANGDASTKGHASFNKFQE